MTAQENRDYLVEVRKNLTQKSSFAADIIDAILGNADVGISYGDTLFRTLVLDHGFNVSEAEKAFNAVNQLNDQEAEEFAHSLLS